MNAVCRFPSSSIHTMRASSASWPPANGCQVSPRPFTADGQFVQFIDRSLLMRVRPVLVGGIVGHISDWLGAAPYRVVVLNIAMLVLLLAVVDSATLFVVVGVPCMVVAGLAGLRGAFRASFRRSGGGGRTAFDRVLVWLPGAAALILGALGLHVAATAMPATRPIRPTIRCSPNSSSSPTAAASRTVANFAPSSPLLGPFGAAGAAAGGTPARGAGSGWTH